MKHIKLFENQTDYKSFKSSDEFVLPNVSLVKDDNSVAYNPIPKPEVIEYHFEIPVSRNNIFLGEIVMEGEVYDDYSEIFDKIKSLVEQYGEDGVLGTAGSGPLANPKITVNEFYVEYICYFAGGEDIDLYTNAMTGNNTLNNAALRRDSIRFSYSAGSEF